MTENNYRLAIIFVGWIAVIGMVFVGILSVAKIDVPSFFEIVTAGAVAALGGALTMQIRKRAADEG